MFNRALKNKIQYLEERIDRLERQERCRGGVHVWEVDPNSYKPSIRCKHCFKAA